jgi:hypothetical protein
MSCLEVPLSLQKVNDKGNISKGEDQAAFINVIANRKSGSRIVITRITSSKMGVSMRVESCLKVYCMMGVM